MTTTGRQRSLQRGDAPVATATARSGERDVDRIDTTLLELVSIASELTSDDTEVIEIVRSLLRGRTVRLRGTFRDAPIESL